MEIRTERTILRPWRAADAPAFSALHADPEVMRDTRGVFGRSESDDKLQRYRAAFEEHGFCRWAVDDLQGRFLGYAGVMPIPANFPVAPGYDIGWRFVRSAWGQGLATEAASASLEDVFRRTRIAEVLSFTSATNARSQAVMQRLNLQRDETRDFVLESRGVAWRAMLWFADRNWRKPALE
jgi:RimJ/RimL family protein N-acetyltransferase